jgi:hypothetical protein
MRERSTHATGSRVRSVAISHQGKSVRRSHRGEIVALAIPFVFALITILRWLCRITAPVTWDYGPAQLAIRVDILVRGVALYRDFRTAPFIPLIYGPIVPWITASLAPGFGSGPMAALEAGRVLTIASTFTVCALIFVLARNNHASFPAASLATLGFVLSPIVLLWGFEYRVDAPALALELGGIFAFAGEMVAPAIAMFAASFFIKQEHAIGIVAVVLFCWWSGERRRACTLGISWLAIVAIGTAILIAINPWYSLNAFGAVRVMRFDFSAPILFFGVMIGGSVSVAILSIVALTRRRITDPLMLCLLGVALAHDLASCLRWGSNAYYFLPTLSVLAIISANGINLILERVRAMRAAPQLAAGFGLALALSLGYLSAPRELTQFHVDPAWDAHALKRLRSISGPIITDTAELSLIDARPNLQWIDLMVLASMKELGTFDDAPLLADIRAHRIAAFALDADGLNRNFRGRPFFWPTLRREIENNYTTVPGAGAPFLMLPNSASTGSVANR